jgi:hypothetical protein
MGFLQRRDELSAADTGIAGMAGSADGGLCGAALRQYRIIRQEQILRKIGF